VYEKTVKDEMEIKLKLIWWCEKESAWRDYGQGLVMVWMVTFY
jgi:hypothetical protein